MASLILIPKRKLESLDSIEEADTLIQNAIDNTPGPGIADTVAKLHVTKRLKIPVGTDMYD